MIFGVANLCLNPQRNYEFQEKRCSESQTLGMGITKIFCPTVYIFPPIWTQFGTREDHKSLFSDCEFRENRCSESHNIFKGVNEFISVLYVRVAI